MEKITSELRAERGNSSRRSRNSSVTGSHIIRKLPEGACLTVRTYDVTGGTASGASSFYRTGLFYTIGKFLPYRIKKLMDRTAAEWKMSLTRPAAPAIFDCRENPASGILFSMKAIAGVPKVRSNRLAYAADIDHAERKEEDAAL